MHHRFMLLFSFLVGLGAADLALAQKHASNSYVGKAPPELVSEPEHWIGGTGPLTLEQLKGKVVWLNFNF